LAAVVLFLIGMAGRFLYGEWCGTRSYRQAEEALRSYHYEEAQHDLEHSLTCRPGHYPTHLLLARVCRQRGDFERAEKYLKHAADLREEPSQELQFERLLLQATRGETEPVFGKLVPYVTKETQETPLVLEALGKGFFSQQDPGNAQWCAERWCRVEPKNPWAYLLEGRVHLQAGHYKEAKTSLEKGLELDPENAEIRLPLAPVHRFLERFELARGERAKGAYEKASRLLTELLAEGPDNATILYERGLLEMDQGMSKQAVGTFQEVLTIDPLRPLTHQKLSECFRQLGKYTEAEEYAARGKELDTVTRRLEALSAERARSLEKPAVHHQIGELLFGQGKVGAAMKSFRIALDLDPNYRPTHRLLADYYKTLGKFDEESRHRRRAGP
jgi:tetratricopeptide (TPR) repeat protein